MAVRARVTGWNVPSVASLIPEGDEPIPQGVPSVPSPPQIFNLEVTDAEAAGGEEYFQFHVHTPETLEALLGRRGAVFGRGMVIAVDEYDLDHVAETMRPLVESVEAETWEELAFRIGSLGPWEFEGWKWHPEEEKLRPDDGVQALIRDVRLLRIPIGDSFSVPIEVRFGGTGVDEDLTVAMALQSPLWIRTYSKPGEILLGSGRLFALTPDPEGIRGALTEEGTAAFSQAPSWDLLRHTLAPLTARDT